MEQTAIKLTNSTEVYDLLEEKSIVDLEGKFIDQDIIAFRVHGLIGDCIKATTILAGKIEENPNSKYVFLISYNDASKKGLIKDLFSDLVESGIVVGLFFNECSVIGNMNFYQYDFLKRIGCSRILDMYYHSSDEYQFNKAGQAYLGFEQVLPKNNKVALFRFSGFHQHVPLRHIPEEGWLDIEKHLISLGLDVHLYGHDDEMETTEGVHDHRREFSVIDTIKHASDSGLSLSTTTFLPLYLHHFIPCLVLVDPSDLAAVSLLWRSTHNYMPINTTLPDFKDYIKRYTAMWYLANMNASAVMSNIKKELVTKVSDIVRA